VQRLLDGSKTVLDIALEHELPFGAVLAYLRKWSDRGLASLTPVVAPVRAPAARLAPTQGGSR
jgi:hypothetical protein